MGYLVPCCVVIPKLCAVSLTELFLKHANHRASPSLEMNRRLILFSDINMHIYASCNFSSHFMACTKAFWGGHFSLLTLISYAKMKSHFLIVFLILHKSESPHSFSDAGLQTHGFEEGHSESFILKQACGLTFWGSSVIFQSIHRLSEGFIAHCLKVRHRVVGRGDKYCSVYCRQGCGWGFHHWKYWRMY